MGRLDVTRRPPPVRLWRAQSRVKQAQLLSDSQRLALAAGDYGMREARFSSVPIRLRIQRHAGPNTELGRKGTIPIGHTRTKRGYPPVTTLPS